MTKEIKGICFLFGETGTEGGWWALQEDGFETEDGHWTYEVLRYLEEGDDFTAYADDGSVLFRGVIHQDDKTGAIPHRVIRKGRVVIDRRWKQQVVGCMWVHWIQKGMDPELWGDLFMGKKAVRTMHDLKRVPRRRLPGNSAAIPPREFIADHHTRLQQRPAASTYLSCRTSVLHLEGTASNRTRYRAGPHRATSGRPSHPACRSTCFGRIRPRR